MDIDAVHQLVIERGRPEVVSTSDDTHIFHFDRDGYWEDSSLLFVNRNGNHFRLIEQPNGDFLFAKTWTGMFDTKPWQIEADFRRPDPEKLMNLCGIGPQGFHGPQFESLCLLPKEATTGRRKVVWRHRMVELSFDIKANSFTLIHPTTGARETFTGKVWESREAAETCKLWFAEDEPLIAVKAVKGPLTAAQSAALESNPLWGMF